MVLWIRSCSHHCFKPLPGGEVKQKRQADTNLFNVEISSATAWRVFLAKQICHNQQSAHLHQLLLSYWSFAIHQPGLNFDHKSQ